ncbi:MAG: hypothetical protein L6R38_006230 [Xanthoria sp. 2 TBL-2021]|nr:MAG: hypothetical protein L6R38_006230 [Xanthoria sp. 2 TBL-2021]
MSRTVTISKFVGTISLGLLTLQLFHTWKRPLTMNPRASHTPSQQLPSSLSSPSPPPPPRTPPSGTSGP